MNVKFRLGLINWLLMVMWVHLVMGLITTWMAQAPFFASYHQGVMDAFKVLAPELERALAIHRWWFELFGATLQAFSAVLLLLLYQLKKQPSARAWGLLAVIILFWAAQDLTVSAKVNLVIHYWVDSVAVIILVIPMVILAYQDKQYVERS